MAFASTITHRSVYGDTEVVWGTFTNGTGDTGGEIATGLKSVEYFSPTLDSGTTTIVPSHSISSGTVTLTTGPGDDGRWFAIGRR